MAWSRRSFARCLADKRAPGKIRHTLADLIGQRVFGIACGHPDGNDADHLADDPIHKLLLGRDPVSGAPLASQPTISRFENGARRTVLYRMGRELAASVIERHRRRLQGRARRITIDLDPTDDLTHGAQQLTFFNGHYGGWCYLPLLGFLSFDREAEQYLCAAVLRPGKAVAADGTLGLLCRLLPLLRAAFPRARFLVRLDGGFATPEIFDFLDAEPRLDYVVAMAKNAVLQRHAESAMQVARAQSEVGGETAHVYTDTRYAARTWDHERRVVIKAEVVRLGDREPRDNPRFVVTNLRQTPRFIYEKVYCARGDIENRIKELLDGLQIDRTSCCLFSANQLRVFLTAAAYVLMQELRLRAARTACARSQVTWLRDRLLKLGVHVVRSVRRVVLHLPRSTPHLERPHTRAPPRRRCGAAVGPGRPWSRAVRTGSAETRTTFSSGMPNSVCNSTTSAATFGPSWRQPRPTRRRSAARAGPARAAGTASSGPPRCRSAARGDARRQVFLILRRHTVQRDRAAAVRTGRRGRRHVCLVSLRRLPAAPLPSVLRPGSPPGTPAASLRPVLGEGSRLSAAGAPRRLELLLQMLATALPVIPILDQLRLVSFEAFDAPHVPRVPADAQVRSNRRGRASCAASFTYRHRRGGTSHSRWARALDSPPVAPRPPASWAAWAAPRRGCRCPTLASVMPPPVGCANPGSACRRRCPRPIPAPITPFGGQIWTFVNNAG